MPFVAPALAPTIAPAPPSMPMLLAGSKLAPSTAAAAPFVPVAGMGMGMPDLGLGDGGLGFGKGEWATLLGRQILELQGALEMVNGSEAGL